MLQIDWSIQVKVEIERVIESYFNPVRVSMETKEPKVRDLTPVKIEFVTDIWTLDDSSG